MPSPFFLIKLIRQNNASCHNTEELESEELLFCTETPSIKHRITELTIKKLLNLLNSTILYYMLLLILCYVMLLSPEMQGSIMKSEF